MNEIYVETITYDTNYNKHTAKCIYCGCATKYKYDFHGHDMEEYYLCSCTESNKIHDLQDKEQHLKKELEDVQKQLKELKKIRCKELLVREIKCKLKEFGLVASDIKGK